MGRVAPKTVQVIDTVWIREHHSAGSHQDLMGGKASA
jgi:hypothetical protein